MTDQFKTDNPELETLFERYRRSPESHVFAPLADACRKAGMIEEAIEICERGVSTHPSYASGLVVRGKCYYDIGNRDQAEASFEKVLGLDANNLVALKFMGVILAERGEAARARDYFKHILALDPDDREIAEKIEDLPEDDASSESLGEGLSEVLGHDDSGYAAVSGETQDSRDAEAEPVELRDVDDESFVGAEISLGDGEPRPDVLATMTLADIYAAQGYRRKAVKIYTELLNDEPGNQTFAAKLRELSAETPKAAMETQDEAEAKAEAEAESEPEPPLESEPEPPPESGSEPEVEAARVEAVPSQPSRPEVAGDEAPESDPETPFQAGAERREAGDDRSRTQFQRWLDNFHG